MAASVSTQTHRFVTYKYFGFPLIVNEKDGFVNATKLCDYITAKSKKDKRFRDYIRTKEWNETVEAYRQRYHIEVHYVLVKGVSEKVKGHYIHPDLIHHVAHWASIEYSLVVADIMKKIHERNQMLQRDTANEVIQQLQKENDEIKQKLIEKGIDIDGLIMRAVPEDYKESYMILINKVDDGKYKVTKRLMSALKIKSIRELSETAIIKKYNLPIGLSFVKDMVYQCGLVYKKNHIINPELEELKCIEEYLNEQPTDYLD